MRKQILLAALFIGVLQVPAKAQNDSVVPVVLPIAPTPKKDFNWKDLRVKLNESGTRYIKFTVLNQVWFRFNQSNPGTTVEGEPKNYTVDVGLRRLRLQLIGQVHEKFLIYLQFGMNSFNNLSPRKAGDFFHDAVVEYTPWKSAKNNSSFSIGGGLNCWSGPLRYSSPAVGAILMADLPIYQQMTNDANDQFCRKLGLYVKGKFGHFDYRIAAANPFPYSSSNLYDPANPISANSQFNPSATTWQATGYFSYQFFDIESNQLPYNSSTYLGEKKVLTLGAGFLYQPKVMWNTTSTGDTVTNPLWSVGADIFYDSYLGARKDMALTVYGAYSYSDFGPGYLRSLGVMNTADGLSPNTGTSISGRGSAFPMYGTGHNAYAQVGWMMPKHWFGKKGFFTIQPYAGTQVSKFDRLNQPMVMVDAGLNFLMEGHRYKFSINYQNRPVFNNNSLQQSRRNSMAYVQFQISI